MNTHENLDPFGNRKGHIEMQQDLLKSLQREISERLFLSGASSRIVKAKPPEHGVTTDTEGVAQLDKIFVPTFAFKNVAGRKEKILSLAVITELDKHDGRSYAYTNLGEIDEQGFMHVFNGIPEDDAWAVFNEAQELDRLKTSDGTSPPLLPQLTGSLLGINNPYTAMMRADDKGSAR